MKKANPPAPFSCKYSPQVPELLQNLRCTIAITTYQAGKVVFISAKDENYLVQLPRNFAKPMGIAENTENGHLALACNNEVIEFSNSPQLAKTYPKSPEVYDSLYLPRVTYHTGPMDIHDLSFTKEGDLLGVNTLFSCIVKINKNFNFEPYWVPNFIDEIVSEDRCHLNGMVVENGKPKYATAFNAGNTFQSWRDTVTSSGIVIDIESSDIVAKSLPMPHSPLIVNSDLYLLLSATGELVKVDVNSGKYDVVQKIDGFVRGMSLYNDYLFVGLSKLRKNSSTFAKLDFADQANRSGIVILHLPTASVVGQIIYQTSVDEIYDVHILADKVRPNILNTLTEDHYRGLMTPKATFWAKAND